jgi:membrane-associated phospholipid phosphatase
VSDHPDRFRYQASAPLTPVWLTNAIRRLLALAGVCTILLLVLYVLAVRTEWGQRAGNAALAGRFHQPPAFIDGSVDLLETISIISLAIVGGTICLIGLIRGGWPLGIGLGVMILGANVTTQALKRVIFTRPSITDQGELAGVGNSLPSGHTTVAMTIAVATLLVSPPRLRPWLGGIASTYAALVGAATVSAGWHRPSDVIAATLVAIGWGALVGAALILLRDRTPVRAATSSRLAHWREHRLREVMVISAGVLAVALATLTLLVVSRSWDDLADLEFTGAFVAGVLAGLAWIIHE